MECAEYVAGAYILSPLQEASKDPLQNAGFTLSWSPAKQTARISSYSMRNSVDLGRSPPSTPTKRTSFSSPLNTTGTQMRNSLSKVLSKAAEPVQTGNNAFAAFKVLPIDPTRLRREAGNAVEPADELSAASNCKEAVDSVVESIVKACKDVGGARQPNFVIEAPIVR